VGNISQEENSDRIGLRKKIKTTGDKLVPRGVHLTLVKIEGRWEKGGQQLPRPLQGDEWDQRTSPKRGGKKRKDFEGGEKQRKLAGNDWTSTPSPCTTEAVQE